MKFMQGNCQYYESGVMKNVKDLNIEINGILYEMDKEYAIENGEYPCNIHIEHTDGTKEVLNNQTINIKGKDTKIALTFKTIGKSFKNTFMSKNMLILFPIGAVIGVFVPELTSIIAIVIAMVLITMGNDYALKKEGFNNAFKARFK